MSEMMNDNTVNESSDLPAGEEEQKKNVRLGMRIRRERNLWNMTQDDLSQILGISTNYLGQIERGNRNISRKLEDKLCEVFHLTHDEFHSRPDPVPEWATHVSESPLIFEDIHEDDLIRLLQGCTSEELQICGHLIRSILYFIRKSGHPVAHDLPSGRSLPQSVGAAKSYAGTGH